MVKLESRTEKEINQNGFALDPDFKRKPKTDCFCHLCQKDIAEVNTMIVLGPVDCFIALRIKDVEANYDVLAFYPVPIGSECAKKLPGAYLMGHIHKEE